MTAETKWAAVRVVITTLYLMLGWVLFTGTLHRETLLLGVAFALITALATYDSFIVESEASWKSLLPRVHWAIAFVVLLLFSVYRSSFQTAWLIIRRRHNPRVVHFRTRLRSDIARAAMATSITVTPGTVTLEMNEDHLIVHWMNATTSHSRQAGTLIKGRLETALQRLWE